MKEVTLIQPHFSQQIYFFWNHLIFVLKCILIPKEFVITTCILRITHFNISHAAMPGWIFHCHARMEIVCCYSWMEIFHCHAWMEIFYCHAWMEIFHCHVWMKIFYCNARMGILHCLPGWQYFTVILLNIYNTKNWLSKTSQMPELKTCQNVQQVLVVKVWGSLNDDGVTAPVDPYSVADPQQVSLCYTTPAHSSGHDRRYILQMW